MADHTHRVGDVVVGECVACHQPTNIRLHEKKSMMGLKRDQYWACERCGKRQEHPAH